MVTVLVKEGEAGKQAMQEQGLRILVRTHHRALVPGEAYTQDKTYVFGYFVSLKVLDTHCKLRNVLLPFVASEL